MLSNRNTARLLWDSNGESHCILNAPGELYLWRLFHRRRTYADSFGEDFQDVLGVTVRESDSDVLHSFSFTHR